MLVISRRSSPHSPVYYHVVLRINVSMVYTFSRENCLVVTAKPVEGLIELRRFKYYCRLLSHECSVSFDFVRPNSSWLGDIVSPSVAFECNSPIFLETVYRNANDRSQVTYVSTTVAVGHIEASPS